jgi:hypothetical protein
VTLARLDCIPTLAHGNEKFGCKFNKLKESRFRQKDGVQIEQFDPVSL